MNQRYLSELHQLEMEDNLRKLPVPGLARGINLSSNDYLGLNDDRTLRYEFLNNAMEKEWKLSAASSRLLTGNSEPYICLENLLAKAFQREASLIYNSGYHANIGVIPSLSGKRDVLIVDKLVHASIIDGIQLSKATMIRFNHLDYNHLEHILQQQRDHFDQAFIISESIFSMDGDRADLSQIIALKKKYDCVIYLDEAHAFGVYGPNGLGCAEESGCISDCDIIVGTFGKAMASLGAFVVCDEVIKQYLVNHSRSFIFTTGLPPLNLAWSIFLFERFPLFEDKRNHLKILGSEFSNWLGTGPPSHIIPFITGTNDSAIKLSKKLQNEGVHVMPIRYPTVPQGKARLRFSLNAGLSLSQLQIIPQILKQFEPTLDK